MEHTSTPDQDVLVRFFTWFGPLVLILSMAAVSFAAAFVVMNDLSHSAANVVFRSEAAITDNVR